MKEKERAMPMMQILRPAVTPDMAQILTQQLDRRLLPHRTDAPKKARAARRRFEPRGCAQQLDLAF